MDEEVERPAFHVTVEDTVGPGTYTTPVYSKRLEGGTLSQCLEYGNAVSGYTVERKGARSCPYRNVVETFWKDTGGIMSDKRK